VLLEVANVAVRYGGAVLALEQVSMDVPAGGAVALLGANGAGKTTLLRAIGDHRGSIVAGDIRLDGRSTRRMDAAQLVAKGLAQTLEGRRMLSELTVAQNLRLGAFALGDRAREAGLRDDVLALFPLLGERLDQRAGLLSGGQQQMLAIGRALMAGPRLLLLDEPSLGLAPIVAAEIAEALLRIRGRGTALLLADQSTALALRATEQAYLLENGRVRASGPTHQLLLDDELRACYLGTAGGHDLVVGEVGG
jgi:ABC-type branched-subunit amino acid transport system ATPase component